MRCIFFYASPRRLIIHLPLPPPAHRYVNVDELDEVERGNKLTDKILEYLVRGKWLRREGDESGVVGAWHISLQQLIATFGADVVKPKVTAFELGLPAARAAAFETIAAELAHEAEEPGG